MALRFCLKHRKVAAGHATFLLTHDVKKKLSREGFYYVKQAILESRENSECVCQVLRIFSKLVSEEIIIVCLLISKRRK